MVDLKTREFFAKGLHDPPFFSWGKIKELKSSATIHSPLVLETKSIRSSHRTFLRGT